MSHACGLYLAEVKGQDGLCRLTEVAHGLCRKVVEMAMAIVLEHNSSKTRILEAYLNSVYFGHGTFGISAASSLYFQKPVQSLTLSEAAVLVAVLPSPEGFSPFHNPKLALVRQQLVLRSMFAAGYLDAAALDAALVGKLPSSLAREPRQRSSHAPQLSGSGTAPAQRETRGCNRVSGMNTSYAASKVEQACRYTLWQQARDWPCSSRSVASMPLPAELVPFMAAWAA